MLEVKNTVELLDGECEGEVEIFIQSLTFDLVKPIAISGHLGDFNVSLLVTMDNGDKVHWVYEGGEMQPTQENYMTINDGKVIPMNDGDCYQDQMREHYMGYLKKKLGF